MYMGKNNIHRWIGKMKPSGHASKGKCFLRLALGSFVGPVGRTRLHTTRFDLTSSPNFSKNTHSESRRYLQFQIDCWELQGSGYDFAQEP